MSTRSLSAIFLASVLSSGACSAAPPQTGDIRLDGARASVRADFANEPDVLFRAEKVVEITGQEGSTATVVCGEVNRRGRNPEIGDGWRPYYYVVSYHPVPVHGPPDLRGMYNDEPGAFDKVSLPAMYAAGDHAVLCGADDAGIADAQAAETFGRSWGKFCTGASGPISEHILQTWR